ncbi:MAG: bacteriochlorophyll 4-vinyl reductase [Gemmatimonadales bacterium]
MTLALSAPTGARIGPNAILQVAEAIRAGLGDAAAEALLAEAGYSLDRLPTAMVDEREPLALGAALIDRYGAATAAATLRDAGERTGAYLLANRIPRPAQRLIRLLPSRLGYRLLLGAIGRHAWTFAGSGRFSVRFGPAGPELAFDDCAMCRGLVQGAPVCDYYAGTFERLFRELVEPRVRVREIECLAAGGRCCRFTVVRG